MLTLDEIHGLKLNLSVAREAYAQVDKRLADVLDTKKVFEQKAFTLFGAHLTAALAIYGIGGTLFTEVAVTPQVIGLFFAGSVFVLAACFFVAALVDDGYGTLGSGAQEWLRKGVIDGADNALAANLAYIVFSHKERITNSIAANNRKAMRIRDGIYAGIAGAVSVGIAMLLY